LDDSQKLNDDWAKEAKAPRAQRTVQKSVWVGFITAKKTEERSRIQAGFP